MNEENADERHQQQDAERESTDQDGAIAPPDAGPKLGRCQGTERRIAAAA
jgi:hypothetical protein